MSNRYKTFKIKTNEKSICCIYFIYRIRFIL
jgi:hypothetical protein